MVEFLIYNLKIWLYTRTEMADVTQWMSKFIIWLYYHKSLEMHRDFDISQAQSSKEILDIANSMCVDYCIHVDM